MKLATFDYANYPDPTVAFAVWILDEKRVYEVTHYERPEHPGTLPALADLCQRLDTRYRPDHWIIESMGATNALYAILTDPRSKYAWPREKVTLPTVRSIGKVEDNLKKIRRRIELGDFIVDPDTYSLICMFIAEADI